MTGPICTSTPFRLPAAMSPSAYLDQVTEGLVRTPATLSVWALDRALAIIRTRPDAAERWALMQTLERRIADYGRSEGWLAPPQQPDAGRAAKFAALIAEDVLGLRLGGVQDKVIGEFKGKLEEAAREALNRRGKTSLTLLQFVWELLNAKTTDDALVAFGKLSIAGLGAWTTKNWQRLLRAGLRLSGVSSRTRTLLLKFIAARLTWLEVAASRLSPWLLLFDLALTPQSTATDEQERRLTFLLLHGRVIERADGTWANLVEECRGPDWRYRQPPPLALTTTIIRAP